AQSFIALVFPQTQEVFASTFVSGPAITKLETFVGREQEMTKLNTAFISMQQGSGNVSILIGEPGIGKTAMAEHFLQSVSKSYPDLLIGRGRCVERFGAGEAY